MLPRFIDDPRFYDDKILTPEEILAWFDVYGTVWVYDSADPKAAHVELHSGKCSNGFFDCRKLFYDDPRLCEIFAGQLVRKLKKTGIKKPDVVIGSSYSAITFSYEVAKKLGVSHRFTETEKDPKDPKKKKQVLTRWIPKDTVILQIEELITTNQTFKEVRRTVEEENPEPVNFLDVVGALVHRPTKLPVNYDGIEVLALIEVEIWAVDPQDCPLCKIGSPRYRPKTNWAKLTGRA